MELLQQQLQSGGGGAREGLEEEEEGGQDGEQFNLLGVRPLDLENPLEVYIHNIPSLGGGVSCEEF